MTLARSARRHMRRAALAPNNATHLSGHSILMLFSDMDHITDGGDLIDMGRKISAQGATLLMAGSFGEFQHVLNEVSCITLDINLDNRGFLADRRIRRSLARLIGRSGLNLVHGVGGRAAWFGSQIAEANGVPFASTLLRPLSAHPQREAEAVVAAQRIFIANPEFTEEFLDMAPQVEVYGKLHRPICW